jgi:hypothetical protein
VGRENIDIRGDPVNSINEAFADDLTVSFHMSVEAVRCILSILNKFGQLSGLYINKDKTHIMVTGAEWEGAEVIEGIKVQKECKLLGVLIDYKGKNVNSNWVKCKTKIRGLISYWNQYNLTLTGRVLVAKTFLISQVSFYLGIIPLDVNEGKQIEDMIEKYAIGKLQIAKDRIYNKIEQGGIGLLKLGELDIAMKSAWVNRWKREGRNVDITGSRVINTARNDNIEYINKDIISHVKYPCARGIANAWHEFRNKVYENDGNLYSAGLFSNPGLRNRMGEMLGGRNIFSMAKYELIQEQIWDIPLGVYCLEEGIREKGEIQEIMGITLTQLEYNKLRGSIKYIRSKYKAVWEMRGKGRSITEWLAPIKRGSNKLRNLMSGRGSRQYRNFSFDKIKPIHSLWEKLGVVPDEGRLSCSMLVWGIKEVETDFRQFAFRWYQGMIHGNTVISHFGDVDRKCTFCKITLEQQKREDLGRELTEGEREELVVPDEDRPHIFWNCSTVYNCVQEIYKGFWGVDTNVDKIHFLLGKDMGTVEATILYMCITMFIKYRIWKYKLANVLPKPRCIVNDLNVWIANLTGHNKWRIMLPIIRQHVRR